ncbi:hypothetical protein AZE42_06152 [Rhizopogon vesiculosus]|uniref:Uncharacterized protein n=1 Tax=Rhizopogon vesiculosus TaxID=180088 RepID=A0A1J8Q837_9AGAM|nr:hypothetical protein AZE42_06152 [Rhizopogon vesiculosus]
MQSTSQQVASPLIPINKPLQRVQSKVVMPQGKVPRAGAATRRVPVRAAPHPQTDMARTRVRKTRALGRVSPMQGPSSMQSTHQRGDITRPSVPTSKLPQRVATMYTRPRVEEPNVTPPLPETDGTDLARTRVRKTRPLSVKPSAVGPLPKSLISNNPIPTEAQLQMTSSQPSQGTSARHGMFRPSKPSMQSTSQQIASPLVPANKPLQRVRGGVVRPQGKVPRVGAATRRVPVRPAPLPQTDMARTHVRKTRALSVKPSAVDPLPKLPISKCDRKSNPITTEVELRTKTSQASRRRVIGSRASKQVVSQKNLVRGGRCVTTAQPKPILNELINAIIAEINNPDTINPPLSRNCEREPPVQIVSHMLVPQDIKRPSYISMGYRIRRPSWRPPREDSLCGASFFTSSLRTSVASPLSPLRIHGAEVIPHVHNPDISCFQGCQLQEVLDRFNLDIELDHATMLYR